MLKKIFTSTTLIGLFATNVYASTCSVTITKPNGKPYTNVRVSGEVAGALGGMVNAVYTDSSGTAILSWSRNRGLSSLFVDGKDRGKCSKNGSRNFILDY